MINVVEDWHWWVVGTLILVLSSLSRSTTMIIAGIAGLIIGFILTVDPAFPVKHQLGGFLIITVTVYLLASPFMKRKTAEPVNEGPGKAYIGKTFTLEYPIIEGSGTLKIDGEIWHIEGKDLQQGVDVRVVACRGETLLVVSESSAQKFEAEKARRQQEVENA